MRNEILEWGPRVRRWILLGLVGGTPLLFLRSGLDPFNVPKLAFLTIGLSIAGTIRTVEILQGAAARGLLRLWVPVAAFTGPMFVSWLLSPYRGWSLYGLFGRFQGLIPYVLVALLGVLVADAFGGRVRELSWAIVISGAGVAGYALLQTIGADPFRWDTFGAPANAISTLGNSNFTGGFLGIALPIAVALVMSDERRGTAIRLTVVIAAGWAVALSQGGWAGGAAGVAVTLGLLLGERNRYSAKAGVVAAAAVAVVIVGVVVVATARPGTRFIPDVLKLRGEWWVSALRMGADSPVWGHGPNSYALEGVKYRTEFDALELRYDFADDPHSIPLSVWASMGILGLLAFFTPAAWAWIHARDEFAQWGNAAGFLGAIAGYYVQSLVSIDQLSLRTSLWAAVGGLAAARYQLPSSQARPERKPARRRKTAAQPLRRIPAVVAVAAVGLAGVTWGGNHVYEDVKAWQGQTALDSNPERAVKQFESALGLRGDDYYRYVYANGIGSVGVAEGTQGRPLIERSQEVFGYLEEVPDLRGLVAQARILHEWAQKVDRDADEKSLELYRRALALDGLNPLIRVEMADVLIELGKASEALDVLQPAAGLVGENEFPEVWGALALTYAHLGLPSQAEKYADIAEELDPGEAHAAEARAFDH